MIGDDTQLDELLQRAAELVDLDHCREVDERHRAALAYEPVDRCPLVVQAGFGEVLELGEPWNDFRRYTYRQTFDCPVAMLQNMLLNRVLPGLLLRDDNPLAIRNDHGIIQIASTLGGAWRLHGDNYPWVDPMDHAALERLAAGTEALDLERGAIPRCREFLTFYREKLAQFPPLDQAVQISIPDLQGPMDTVEMLWGSTVYLAVYEQPELLDRLLARVTDTMLAVAAHLRPYLHDRLEPAATTQHGNLIPGRLLLRGDSSIMLSPQTYADLVRPHDARLLREIGTGSIHFCGNGQHLVPAMLEIPDLRGVDLGQPELMDVPTLRAWCGERRVALTGMQQSREDLLSGGSRSDFPTGAELLYYTTNLDDAQEVVDRYRTA